MVVIEVKVEKIHLQQKLSLHCLQSKMVTKALPHIIGVYGFQVTVMLMDEVSEQLSNHFTNCKCGTEEIPSLSITQVGRVDLGGNVLVTIVCKKVDPN